MSFYIFWLPPLLHTPLLHHCRSRPASGPARRRTQPAAQVQVAAAVPAGVAVEPDCRCANGPRPAPALTAALHTTAVRKACLGRGVWQFINPRYDPAITGVRTPVLQQPTNVKYLTLQEKEMLSASLLGWTATTAYVQRYNMVMPTSHPFIYHADAGPRDLAREATFIWLIHECRGLTGRLMFQGHGVAPLVIGGTGWMWRSHINGETNRCAMHRVVLEGDVAPNTDQYGPGLRVVLIALCSR